MDDAIDYASVQEFWHRRSHAQAAAPESLVNFESDPARLEERIALETAAIMPRMALDAEPDGCQPDVLDLGAGVGQWALRFAPLARSVTAVDYQEGLLERGRQAAAQQGLTNIRFIHSAVEDFAPEQRFARVFLSGILAYLNDELAQKTVATAAALLTPRGRVVLREPCSVLAARHVLSNRYSPALGCEYSAIYRTDAEITALFSAHGLRCADRAAVFPEGHALNKFPETRLHCFVFVPEASHG